MVGETRILKHTFYKMAKAIRDKYAGRIGTIQVNQQELTLADNEEVHIPSTQHREEIKEIHCISMDEDVMSCK